MLRKHGVVGSNPITSTKIVIVLDLKRLREEDRVIFLNLT